jgi:predicted aconitase/predicted aconitase with swiveling domain
MMVSLDDRDRAMLDGAQGAAAQMAMSILLRMAEVFGAPKLLDISGAHIDSTIYIGEGGLEYAERLSNLGARVAVPTTLNVSGLDEHHWQEWAVPANWAEKSSRQMVAYQSMGTVPTWTCAPYQTEWKPKFGQQIAWGESNAIVFANSVIGARTERYPDLLDICCAITGRVPAFGLHLAEHRGGDILLRLVDVPAEIQCDDTFYPVLGHLMGKIAQDRTPVLEGLSYVPTDDQLKALGAAAASSGTIALFHIVGVTPEAPTREAAFRGRPPLISVDITMDLLRSARQELTTVQGDSLDMVVLGSPHFSLAEFKQLAPLIGGKQAHPRVKFLVTSNRAVAQFARQAGYLDALQAFGGQVTVDTCILASPMLPPEIKTLMTNSGKYAYYAPGMLNTQIAFGSLSDCVQSAVEGRIVRDESLWGLAPSRVAIPTLKLDTGERRGGSLERRAIIPGAAEGNALVSREPISFWGGYDYHTGEIIDRRHPLAGSIAAGRILAVPFTRGSSTTTAVLLEAIRVGTAPAAILTTGIDSFFALASIVADEMYGKPIPIVALPPDEFMGLQNGQRLQVTVDGRVLPS